MGDLLAQHYVNLQHDAHAHAMMGTHTQLRTTCRPNTNDPLYNKDDAVEQDEATFCGDDVLRRIFPRTDDTDSGERNPREEGRDTIRTAMPKSALILDGAMENGA